MKKKVAIIGSGIAGLTLASLLQTNSNFEFIVYEKEESLNLDEGFGIQLSVNSVSILNKIGFNQLNKNEKYHPSKLELVCKRLAKVSPAMPDPIIATFFFIDINIKFF